MQKINNGVEALEVLKNELPKCFKRGDEKLPLAVGILESVLKHFENDTRLDAPTLTKAVGLYCKGTKYIRSIVEYAPRIDINGKPVSTVKKSEESYALQILAERKSKKKPKTAANPPKN